MKGRGRTMLNIATDEGGAKMTASDSLDRTGSKAGGTVESPEAFRAQTRGGVRATIVERESVEVVQV